MLSSLVVAGFRGGRLPQPQLPRLQSLHVTQRRTLALPALPLAIQGVMLLGKYLRPLAWVARPATAYMVRWWPYYFVKFTVINQIKRYGAQKVFKHCCWATQRLISNEDERKRVRSTIKTILRVPGDIESDIMGKLVQIDEFLLKWALENEAAVGKRQGYGCDFNRRILISY